MLWVLMARKSYEDPCHTYSYFGVFCGISDAQAGRLLGSALMGQEGPRLALCQNISFAALWAICIFGLVMFFLLQRGQGIAESRRAAVRPGSAGPLAGVLSLSTQPDALAPGGMPAAYDAAEFAVRFEALATRTRLTQREREVLAEALRGGSRASIADKLSLSPETVKTYMNRAYAKTQVSSKQELVELINREPL